MDIDTLKYLINHIFLPLRLPQSEDHDIAKDLAICDRIMACGRNFQQLLPACRASTWDQILTMMERLRDVLGTNTLNENKLLDWMKDLKHGDVLVIPIRTQNACVVIRKVDEHVIVESFEVNPPNATILGTVGRLIRCFPETAIRIPDETAMNPFFQRELAIFLVNIDVELDGSVRLSARRGGENRETCDPHYITQLLTAVLRGQQGSSPANGPLIEKHTRYEVFGEKNGAPWRRSPSWLIMRVAIQSMVNGTDEFKAFMLYFMTSVPLLGDCINLSGDSLHCVGAKLARRLRKLSPDAPGFGVVDNEVSKAVDKITSILGARWKELQSHQKESPRWDPNQLDIQSDTRLSLNLSRDYICRRLSQGTHEASPPDFEPTEFPRLMHTLRQLNGLTSANLSAALAKDPITALIDLEHFVASDLSQWVANRRLDESACVVLSECLDVYATTASKYYSKNPECESIKLVTMLQMWVALDQLATAQLQLLLDYSPEVPMNLLETLLLRDSLFIGRLKDVQSHLSGRYSRACKGSIFQEHVNPTSFAVRYFNSSPELRALKENIEADAEAIRREKLQELQEKSQEYHSRIQKAQMMECDYRTSYYGSRYHANWCYKCREEVAANDMRIEVHEWPLPPDDLVATATVFELKCPIVYQTWRSTTYMLLYDFCQPSQPSTTGDPPLKVKDYTGLNKYAGRISRITYASPRIPESSSKNQRVSRATRASICVDNPLSLQLFDAGKGRWVVNPFTDCTVDDLCTYVLPNGPYRPLQDTLSKTTHPPNLAIVKQSEASTELTLHEYLAFSELRSGSLLQWLNVARELRTGVLSFSRLEVQMLIAQAAWQIGPISSSGALSWHTQLECSQFGERLITETEYLLSKIERNWGHAVALQTIILLLARVLQFATEESVIRHAYKVLRRGRKVAWDWMQTICESLDAAESETVINDLQRRICALAATCRATFDVDPPHLGHLLSSESDLKELVCCLIRVHDNTNNPSSDLRRLLARDGRLSRSSLSALWDIVQRSPKGLDDAILEIWAEYRCGTESWIRLPEPNDRWITTTTAASDSSSKSKVHLNLLDGTLLVKGTLLKRLPPSIVQHATYKRILGSKILDIIPSNMPGMDFATRNPISSSGFHLHFKLEEPNNLVVQAKKDHNVYELIPHETFDHDFPISFVHEYVHWLQLSPPPLDGDIREIEFRPMQTKWSPSTANWRLKFSETRRISTMEQGTTLLIDMRSATFNMISTRLKPLESLGYVHITTTASDEVNLLASLPRYQLSFFLNRSYQLESTNFRGMIVDADQFTGTMVGLTSQLVLTQEKTANPCLIPARSVVIPFGPIHPEESLSIHHVATRVEVQNSSPSVRYFKYDIDADLGRLIGTTLLSDFYKIYLHASTAYPMPDPLTGRTGTEEALSELNSARCLSFQTLTMEEHDILCNIAGLAPAQEQHNHHVQSLTWNGVGPLAQHWGFRTLVQTILQFHERLSIFSKDETPLPVPDYDRDLHNRLASRNYHLYTAEYGFFELNVSHDVKYPRTDQNGQGYPAPSLSTIQLAANVSALVRQWPHQLSTVSDLWERMKSFGETLSLAKSHNPSLSFSTEFLKPSLGDIWLFLYDHCRGSVEQEGKRYQLMFTLATFAYQTPDIHQLLPTILAFATIPAFSTIDHPGRNSYNLGLGIAPDERQLRELLTCSPVPLADSPSNNLTSPTDETVYEFRRRRQDHYVAAYIRQAESFVSDIASQWLRAPFEEPLWTSYKLPLISLSNELKKEINKLFHNWYKNWQLCNHIQEVQRVLDKVRSDRSLEVPRIVDEYVSPILSSVPGPLYSAQELASLVKQNSLSSLHFPRPPRLLPLFSGYLVGLTSTPETTDLQPIVHKFTQDPRAVRRQYGQTLEKSILSQKDEQLKQLETYCVECHKHFKTTLGLVIKEANPKLSVERVGHSVGQWPRVTIRTLLGMLSETSKSQLSEGWKSCIVFLAESMLRYQRARRLLRYYCLNAKDDFRKEYENDLDPGSDILAEWLLIQIEGNFLLRSIQRRVAEEMIQPSVAEEIIQPSVAEEMIQPANSLLQLNMGEGKSSVIVPIISSSLADGNQLLRVVVLKPLAKQMFDVLVRRLSGLANRRIFYLPFSRGVGVSAAGNKLQPLFDLCMRERGILLAQPEHILSFKLMGIDMAIRKDKSSEGVAKSFLTSQSWLDRHSRDVLDESDEILNVKYQLIYTSGRQEPLEDHPDRWIRIQRILDCTKKHARLIRKMKPEALEVVEPERKGGFPIIRILDTDVGVELSERIAKDILTSTEQFRLLTGDVRQAALQFVTCAKGDVPFVTSALDGCRGTSLWKTLLHFRGVFGLGILQFALQKKRWPVDYGLHLARTLLAVPYRAKDVPTLRADFGHPDVAVILTCLSYYYDGLKDDQLDLCFELLFKLDNPPLEYEVWVADCDEIPQSLREIIGVNLDDLGQRECLRCLFRKTQAVINFYLSNVVFPKEAKQFTSRLSTSSWDLAGRKGQVTTGFSGTNDNRDLLPTSIQQHDPVNQQGTNALVLGYVLRPENDHYACLNPGGQPLSSCDFLKRMVEADPPIQVLLDVGAQMLDMKTPKIASKWLSLASKMEAVVFLDDSDQLVVMSRDRSIEPLVSSQFNDKLDVCGIYLDDAHTRGTDLKLPTHFRAAVTLGPQLAKDRLVQGCMRMRKLGHGQSLMFLAPQEVDRAIRDLGNFDPSDPSRSVTSLDIINWTISNTCDHIEHHLTHWAQQGVEYMKRREAWAAYESDPSAGDAIDKLRLSWEEPDARSLEDMYGSETQKNQSHPAFDIPDMRDRLKELGVLSVGNAKVDEEQEREVSQEIEREREVQRPPPAKPAQHFLHDHVRQLVTHGVIDGATTIANSSAFVQLFSPLRHLGEHEWSPSLWATKDFATTIADNAPLKAIQYLRPVHWLLSLKRPKCLLVLSPYEVNELLPSIQNSKFVHLHIYAPRVTQAMRTLENLDFFCIPPLPVTWSPPTPTNITQLNLFAGQLYLKDYCAYTHLRRTLGLVGDETEGEQGQWWENDGFVAPENRRGIMEEICKLSSSPLPFWKKLVGLRRKGLGYQSTHVGRILRGGLLTREDFEKDI